MPKPQKFATLATARAPWASGGDLLADYCRARVEFFDRYGARWPATLADGFDLLAPYVLDGAEIRAIRDAAGAVSAIYRRTCDLLTRLSDDALLNLTVPVALIPIVRSLPPTMEDSVIARLDLVRTDSGYKLLEINADEAGLIVESFSVNEAACAAAGLEGANAGCEELLCKALENAVQTGLQSLAGSFSSPPTVVVTAFGNCSRDVAAAEYLCHCLRRNSARHIPIEQLQLSNGDLYDGAGKKVHVLIRLAPIRLLRRCIKAENSGGDLLDVVRSGRLALINAPSSFLLTNKALQAIIWKLSAAGEFFSAEESALIQKYLLPTFLELPDHGGPYVQKPFHAAEGDGVSIIERDGRVLHHSLNVTHADAPMVYQQYVPLPSPELMTEFGPRKLHLVTSCFLLAGEPSAIGIRAGEPITDHSAWVMPVAASFDG
jgi:glutathionylspermidine synthase